MDRASPALRRRQRVGLLLLILSGSLSYVDRATLSVANPFVRHDLGLSVGTMGVLMSAFLWAYAFSQLPAGILIDRVGPRRVLPAGLALWSVAQMLGGAVTGFTQFFVARLLLGVGESPQSPGSASVTRSWFNRRRRGFATGIWNCSSTLGQAVALPLLTTLLLLLGWRWMFAVMGLVSIILAGFFYFIHRDPDEVALSESDRAYLAEGDEPPGVPLNRQQWRRLFTFRTSWGLIAGYFGCIYVLWLYNAWLPAYLQMDRHMSIARTGWVAAIPYVFGVAGSLFGGRVVDIAAARGYSQIDSCRYPAAAALVGTAVFTLLAAEVQSNALAVACISAALFLIYIATTAAWALAAIAVPGNCTGSVGSMQNCGGYIGGALAPIVTGFVVQATGTFAPALLVGSAAALLAALAYMTMVRKVISMTDIVSNASAS
jgi:sugar phosphate permease